MRIASLSPAVTEILFALEQHKKIVCTDQFSDFPEAAKEIPHMRGMVRVDPEELRKYEPEIVMLGTSIQTKLADQLRSMDFSVLHEDPRSLADIYAWIRQIGILLSSEPRAEALVQTMQQGFNETKRRAGLLQRKPRVYVEEWHHPPMASGNWVPEVVRIAGGVPVAIEGRGGEELGSKNEKLGTMQRDEHRNPLSREVSLAEIQAFDPDMIVLSICGAGAAASKDLLTKRAGWSELRAVRENHLFVIDDSLLNRPGPRLVEGARRLFGWMFQVLH